MSVNLSLLLSKLLLMTCLLTESMVYIKAYSLFIEER